MERGGIQMVALAPNALPIDEQIIKLADAPKFVPFCRKTVKKWVDTGRLEAWYLGDTEVTTKEAVSRAAIKIEPKPHDAEPERRKAPPKARDAISRFLALR